MFDFDNELKSVREKYVLKAKKIKNLTSYIAWKYFHKKPGIKLLYMVKNDIVIKTIFNYEENPEKYFNLFNNAERLMLSLLEKSYELKEILELKVLIYFCLLLVSNNKEALDKLFAVCKSKYKRMDKFYSAYILNNSYCLSFI